MSITRTSLLLYSLLLSILPNRTLLDLSFSYVSKCPNGSRCTTADNVRILLALLLFFIGCAFIESNNAHSMHRTGPPISIYPPLPALFFFVSSAKQWQEPPDARAPTKKWRLYVFKGEAAVGVCLGECVLRFVHVGYGVLKPISESKKCVAKKPQDDDSCSARCPTPRI